MTPDQAVEMLRLLRSIDISLFVLLCIGGFMAGLKMFR